MMFAKKLAAAATVLGLSAGLAAASPAVTETDLNMRNAPGTWGDVITVIPGGATVDVAGCSGGWCDVAWAGFQGYASASYLDAIGSSGVVVAPPPAVVVRPGVVVRDRRYVGPRRAWRGIRGAIRREARRDRREWRRDRREWRREVRRDRRQDRRAERRQERRVERRQLRRGGDMRSERRQMRQQQRQARRADRMRGGR